MPALNPYEAGAYTYGGLPLYLYLFSARFMTAVTGDAIWGDKWHITLIARAYAAIASTFIILLLYLLSHKLGMSRTAWIPALAFAVSPLAIQYAHYGVVDTLLSFWVVLVSLLSLWALEEKSDRRWINRRVRLGVGHCHEDQRSDLGHCARSRLLAAMETNP